MKDISCEICVHLDDAGECQFISCGHHDNYVASLECSNFYESKLLWDRLEKYFKENNLDIRMIGL